MPDQLTHLIVGLVEHAELSQQTALESQKAVDVGARALETAAAGLDESIKKAIADAVKKNLKDIPAELKEAVANAFAEPVTALGAASDDIGKVTGTLRWKAVAVAALLVFAAMLAPMAFWALFIPSNTEIQQLRAERDQLQADTARLRGAESIVLCGPKKVPCAPVDPNLRWTSQDGSVTYYAVKH
ncbi:hypothetical protein OVY01_22810 [Robbsia sp. Bb-Pol-6]|uniref:MobB n=1 Tax=Robbsia betulipollinis TaxID=2981849 RepID=A0ABT3ZVU8_9BURK|nr:hypothetical protein [Robbsia betulipollinis]MCY0389973.1 hypothetical protein [Robbsia betulipollinis]